MMSNVAYILLLFGVVVVLSRILKEISSVKSLLGQMHKDITDLKPH